MSEEKQHTYRNPARLAGFLRFALGALAGTELVLAAGMTWQYRLLEMMRTGAFETRDEMMAWANTSDAAIAAVQWGIRAFLLAGLVLFFMWVYRANANVRALGATNLDITPGFAVGVYFIPFANLFYPPQNMNQVWKASIDASNWREQKGTSLVALWWTFQILCGIGGWMTLLIGPREESGIAALQTFSLYMLAYFLACAALHIMMVILMGDITRAQIAQHERLRPAA